MEEDQKDFKKMMAERIGKAESWICPDCGAKLKVIQPWEYHPDCKKGDTRGCSNPKCEFKCWM